MLTFKGEDSLSLPAGSIALSVVGGRKQGKEAIKGKKREKNLYLASKK